MRRTLGGDRGRGCDLIPTNEMRKDGRRKGDQHKPKFAAQIAAITGEGWTLRRELGSLPEVGWNGPAPPAISLLTGHGVSP